jgi:glucokinase
MMECDENHYEADAISPMARDGKVLAVDIGGTKTAVGVVDAAGKVIEKSSARTPLGHPADLVGLVSRLAEETQRRAGKATRAGVALPGVVDSSRRVLVRSPSSGWSNVPFVALLEEAIGMHIEADNDVNACAWAESRFGACRGLRTFFWMTVSTGIGGALFAEGHLVRGANEMAGEIGHLVVNPGGEACGCGHKGCLEAEAAGPSWTRRALKLLDGSAVGYLASLPREAIDARSIAEGAKLGDESCRSIVREVGAMLARGLAAIESVLDPEAIIIGGGVASSLDLLLPFIREFLPSLVLNPEARRTLIGPSELGYDAALVGAASLALHPY